MGGLDLASLRKDLINEEDRKNNRSSGGKSDKRVLNYFDLDFGQKMTVRLLPDSEGKLWREYTTHGTGVKNRDVKNIGCSYASNGESCPVCLHAFAAKDDGDDIEFNVWKGKRYTLAQCIVVDSPIEVNQADDGNPVKLFYVPFGIKEMIKQEIITEDVDPTSLNLVIKKTKKGTNANYDSSHLIDSEIPEHVLDSLSSEDTYVFRLGDEIPDGTTTAQMQEWFDNAKASLAGIGAGSGDAPTAGDIPTPNSSKKEVPASSSGKKVNPMDLVNQLKNRETQG